MLPLLVATGASSGGGERGGAQVGRAGRRGRHDGYRGDGRRLSPPGRCLAAVFRYVGQLHDGGAATGGVIAPDRRALALDDGFSGEVSPASRMGAGMAHTGP